MMDEVPATAMAVDAAPFLVASIADDAPAQPRTKPTGPAAAVRVTDPEAPDGIPTAALGRKIKDPARSSVEACPICRHPFRHHVKDRDVQCPHCGSFLALDAVARPATTVPAPVRPPFEGAPAPAKAPKTAPTPPEEVPIEMDLLEEEIPLVTEVEVEMIVPPRLQPAHAGADGMPVQAEAARQSAIPVPVDLEGEIVLETEATDEVPRVAPPVATPERVSEKERKKLEKENEKEEKRREKERQKAEKLAAKEAKKAPVPAPAPAEAEELLDVIDIEEEATPPAHAPSPPPPEDLLDVVEMEEAAPEVPVEPPVPVGPPVEPDEEPLEEIDMLGPDEEDVGGPATTEEPGAPVPEDPAPEDALDMEVDMVTLSPPPVAAGPPPLEPLGEDDDVEALPRFTVTAEAIEEDAPEAHDLRLPKKGLFRKRGR